MRTGTHGGTQRMCILYSIAVLSPALSRPAPRPPYRCPAAIPLIPLLLIHLSPRSPRLHLPPVYAAPCTCPSRPYPTSPVLPQSRGPFRFVSSAALASYPYRPPPYRPPPYCPFTFFPHPPLAFLFLRLSESIPPSPLSAAARRRLTDSSSRHG